MFKNLVVTLLLFTSVGILATPLLVAPVVVASFVACVIMLREGYRSASNHGNEAQMAMKLLTICFGFWFLVSLIPVFVHHDPLREVDTALRFLLSIGVLWIILVTETKKIEWIYYGVILGSIGACGIAIYQHAVLDVPRVQGWTNNPIYFGNMSFLLSLYAAVILATYWSKMTPIWRILMIMSIPLAIFASLTSMTRSSFLALVGLLVLFNLSRINRVHRLTTVLVSGAVFSIALLVTMQLMETSRYAETLSDIQQIREGKYSGGLGQRLKIWQTSLQILEPSPFLGVGRDAYQDQIQKLLSNDPAWLPLEPIIISQPHSGLLDAMVTSGVPGLVAFLMLFVMPYWLLLRLPTGDSRASLMFCRLGKVTVIAFFIFALTNSIFRMQIYAVAYPMSLAVFIALAINFRARYPKLKADGGTK